MFRRTKSDETATATTAPVKEGGKGRPTPSRKEAEAAARARARAPRDKKAARQYARQQRASQSAKMREEGLRRHDTALLEQQRRAGYISGGAEPNPVVVTFTTETATMAVNELLHRLTGFRGSMGSCSERVRRFDEVKDADTVPGGKPLPHCKLCARHVYDARGDMEPFLDQT